MVCPCRNNELLIGEFPTDVIYSKQYGSKIRREVLSRGMVNFDETYLRVNGKQQYMHTASTPDATYQTVDESRGMIDMDHAGILPYFDGIAIHDY